MFIKKKNIKRNMCLTKIMNNFKIYIVLNSYLSKNYKNQSSHKKLTKFNKK